jgi:hypothetical protein
LAELYPDLQVNVELLQDELNNAEAAYNEAARMR